MTGAAYVIPDQLARDIWLVGGDQPAGPGPLVLADGTTTAGAMTAAWCDLYPTTDCEDN